MGGSSSKSDSGGGGGFSVFLLCGGSDNVVDDTEDAAPPPFLQNYARRSQRIGARRRFRAPAGRALRSSFSSSALAARARALALAQARAPARRRRSASSARRAASPSRRRRSCASSRPRCGARASRRSSAAPRAPSSPLSLSLSRPPLFSHAAAARRYGRKGKPSARVFRLDDSEEYIIWNTSKLSTKRRVSGSGRVDSVALLEITDVTAARARAPPLARPGVAPPCPPPAPPRFSPDALPPRARAPTRGRAPREQVHRGADAIPFDVAPEIARCCLSLRCGSRQLALQVRGARAMPGAMPSAARPRLGRPLSPPV